MRKHDVRKWLHAILDLLPVFLIPVFMIYSHRHDVSQDFEVVTPTPVYYETNEISDYGDFIVDNAYLWTNDIVITNENTIPCYNIMIEKDTFDVFFPSYNYEDITSLRLGIWQQRANIQLYIGTNWVANKIVTNINFRFLYLNSYDNVEIMNLLAQHVSPCYDYLKEYHDVVTTIPHDVMTSFMDRFNNTIDKYFNMGNVFNLNGVYQWFNTNIFSDNAPTIIYSIWNIALYELVMDLLFLLYGLFMWFIDMVQTLMDKPFKSIK